VQGRPSLHSAFERQQAARAKWRHVIEPTSHESLVHGSPSSHVGLAAQDSGFASSTQRCARHTQSDAGGYAPAPPPIVDGPCGPQSAFVLQQPATRSVTDEQVWSAWQRVRVQRLPSSQSASASQQPGSAGSGPCLHRPPMQRSSVHGSPSSQAASLAQQPVRGAYWQVPFTQSPTVQAPPALQS